MSILSNLKVKLGVLNTTQSVEEHNSSLLNEMKEFTEFPDTEEYKQYLASKAQFESGIIDRKKKECEALSYQSSVEFTKEVRWKELSKSKSLLNYYKIKDSELLQRFVKLEGSSLIEEFESLEKVINSLEFIEKKNSTPKKEFKDTDEFSAMLRYKELKSSSDIKFYYKWKKSPAYSLYLSTIGSKEIIELETLDVYVKSEEFLTRKSYLQLPWTKKYEQTIEFKAEEEFKALSNSPKIKWYHNLVKDNHKFDILHQWKLVFEDDFNDKTLSTDHWITKYFYGEALAQTNFSTSHDHCLMTDGKNLTIKNSILSILTKSEKTQGKAWHPKNGFYNKNYDYTSGIISSGHAFRFQYGKIEIKAKVQKSAVLQAAWLSGDKASPHVNIFTYANGKLRFGHLWGSLTKKGVKEEKSSTLVSKADTDFFIYTLEWSENSLIWYVNGIEAARQTKEVPRVPLFLNFCSSLYNKPQEQELPSEFSIDYVKVYERK